MATESQRQSWQEVSEKLTEKQICVFKAIQRASFGATLFELVGTLGLPVNSISGRVTELVGKGYVELTGTRRINPTSGKSGAVWRATDRYALEVSP